LAGEPREIMGLGRERCVYAAVAGEVSALVEIGAWVEAGEIVALVGSESIHAPISGFIRGICHSGVQVNAGSKVIELDPRTEGASLYGLGERPLRLAEAVVKALATHG
jgi:xanthine dehydrogenase accessory factor